MAALPTFAQSRVAEPAGCGCDSRQGHPAVSHGVLFDCRLPGRPFGSGRPGSAFRKFQHDGGIPRPAIPRGPCRSFLPGRGQPIPSETITGQSPASRGRRTGTGEGSRRSHPAGGGCNVVMEDVTGRRDGQSIHQPLHDGTDRLEVVIHRSALPTKRALLAERRLSIATEALEIIAGKRQCLDNLMGNRDVAEDALRRIAASSDGGE